MQFLTPVGKGRKPRFDLHLKIYDLNNVPLVSGISYIKWHLSHSIHTEHRGRTPKCPIVNHRVDYGYNKNIQHIRISVDKNSNLAECPIEFEIIQEFAGTEKVTLGVVKLNLSEYVGESEPLTRSMNPEERRRANSTDVSPTNVRASRDTNHKDDGPDGIVRRYLMQESKVNSTLKMSILMVQVDGERNFIPPPLKTATAFAGIAGIVHHEPQLDDEPGITPSFSKSQDTAEIQDLYRRVLSASWRRLPSELPADESIEDVFAGGDGWGTYNKDSSSSSDSDPDDDGGGGTLRPGAIHRMGQSHRRRNQHSGHSHHHHHQQQQQQTFHKRGSSTGSTRSANTLTGRSVRTASAAKSGRVAPDDDRDPSELSLKHSGSMASLGQALEDSQSQSDAGSGRGTANEVGENDIRDDLMAWRMPS